MPDQNHDVRNLALAADGRRRIEWAAQEMPVIAQINDRFTREQPLKGIRIGACLHVTTETANLIRVLHNGGAEIRLCASNPLSTQDDVAAAIVADFRVPVFAMRKEDNETYYQHIHGRRISFLTEGRLVNLSAAEGHPSAVMDMSFANQTLCVEYLAKHGGDLSRAVHPVPPEIDEEIARLKLSAMGIEIDKLSDEQRDYLTSWKSGT